MNDNQKIQGELDNRWFGFRYSRESMNPVDAALMDSAVWFQTAWMYERIARIVGERPEYEGLGSLGNRFCLLYKSATPEQRVEFFRPTVFAHTVSDWEQRVRDQSSPYEAIKPAQMEDAYKLICPWKDRD